MRRGAYGRSGCSGPCSAGLAGGGAGAVPARVPLPRAAGDGAALQPLSPLPSQTRTQCARRHRSRRRALHPLAEAPSRACAHPHALPRTPAHARARCSPRPFPPVRQRRGLPRRQCACCGGPSPSGRACHGPLPRQTHFGMRCVCAVCLSRVTAAYYPCARPDRSKHCVAQLSTARSPGPFKLTVSAAAHAYLRVSHTECSYRPERRIM